MMYHRFLFGVFLLAATAGFPQSAAAAPQNIELILSAGRLIPELDTSYVHSYAPRLEYGTSSGTARQVLNLKAESLSGFGAGLNVFPAQRIGVQILLDSFSTILEGSSGPYVLSLQYQSRQPPQYELRTYTYERTSPGPPAEGTLEETAVSLNVLFRIPAGRNLAMDLSAGPTLFFISASAETLLYTKFRLGGHSVLFSDDYDLGLDIPSAVRLGFNIGTELILFPGRVLAVGCGIRYAVCPAYDAGGRLRLIERPQGYLWDIDLASENIPVSPLRVNPSFLRLGLSVRIRI